jgi:hypothetical protein
MTGSFDPILLSLVRKAMPHALAQSIVGVQPMTGPTGAIFAHRAPYPFGGCDLKDCQPDFWLSNDFVVDVTNIETAFERGQEVVNWAILNCRRPYNYYSLVLTQRQRVGPEMADTMRKYKLVVPEPEMSKTWRWMFTDENDAFAFRMRWT